MSRQTFKSLLFCAFLLSNVGPLCAQQPVQVVSSTWEESYTWTERSKLLINGEQAEINLRSHKGDKLKCTIVRESRHSDKGRAEADLQLLKLLHDESGRSISLRNYVELGKGASKPEAKLKTIYNISLPENGGGTVEIRNYFGAVNVDAVTAGLTIKVEFSNVQMKAYAGQADVEMKYGDAQLSTLSGHLALRSDRSNIDLQHLRGSAKITAAYAKIRLLNLYEPEGLSITASRSEIYLDIPTRARLGYAIETNNVVVNHPSGKQLEQMAGTDGKVHFNYTPSGKMNTAEISLQTGTIQYIVQ